MAIFYEKKQATNRDRQLILANSELRKENLRLVKKIAKLESKMVTIKNHEAQMKKFSTVKPIITEKRAKEIMTMIKKQIPDNKPAA